MHTVCKCTQPAHTRQEEAGSNTIFTKEFDNSIQILYACESRQTQKLAPKPARLTLKVFRFRIDELIKFDKFVNR